MTDNRDSLIVAAVRAANGAAYLGTNVENAAYPLGNCAETSAIAAGRRLQATHQGAGVRWRGCNPFPLAGERDSHGHDRRVVAIRLLAAQQPAAELAGLGTRSPDLTSVHICAYTIRNGVRVGSGQGGG
jgi:nucleoside-diphosphate-sugar epimerase